VVDGSTSVYSSEILYSGTAYTNIGTVTVGGGITTVTARASKRTSTASRKKLTTSVIIPHQW
jgi:hypothetical protein